MALVSLEDTTLTSIGDSIRSKLGEDTKYLPQEMPDAILSIPKEEIWEWGSEDGIGDLKWWEGLKNWIESASEADLANCMGKKKKITLTSAILGTTTHDVMAVAYNLDKPISDLSSNTLTFQTANCLATTTVFGSSNCLWKGSTVESLCQSYYNALPFKSLLLSHERSCATAINANQNASTTRYTGYVFLPSDCEMGFIAGKSPSAGKGYAASYREFSYSNTLNNKASFQYYKDDNSRIKKKGDSGSTNKYWERSICYDTTSDGCCIGTGGKATYGGYNLPYGFAPIFVI